ncbi:hypothetical protein CPC08DRAFT_269444 [Agrocybe pediades]|nr:hypothetical protein CPC08DRAFT_269444 [Agrocybe pediades]
MESAKLLTMNKNGRPSLGIRRHLSVCCRASGLSDFHHSLDHCPCSNRCVLPSRNRLWPPRQAEEEVLVHTILLRLSTAGQAGGCIWMRVQLKRMKGDTGFAKGHRSFCCHLSHHRLSRTPSAESRQ